MGERGLWQMLYRAFLATRSWHWNLAALLVLSGWHLVALLPLPRFIDQQSVWIVPPIVIGCLIVSGVRGSDRFQTESQPPRDPKAR